MHVLLVNDENMSGLNLPETFMGRRTLEFISQAFKARRSNIGEYLNSCFYHARHLAIEWHRESTSTGVSHGPGSSGMIQPLQSDPSQHSLFLESLQELKVALSEEELPTRSN